VTTAQARRDCIAKMAEERDTLSVSELIVQFGVTDTSIRHDLTLLEEAGKLRRVRGGAVSRASARLTGFFPARARENPLEKRRIGLAAAGLVQAGNVVLFDSGSTVTEVATHISGALRAPHDEPRRATRERHRRNAHGHARGERNHHAAALADERLTKHRALANLRH